MVDAPLNVTYVSPLPEIAASSAVLVDRRIDSTAKSTAVDS